LAFDGL